MQETVMSIYTAGLHLVFNWQTLFFMFGGVFLGITVGALPGLSGTMAVGILVSLTYGLPPNTAMLMLIGVYAGSVYGGSISAILINIPGTPSAIMTALDGYPMTLKGQAGRAIGIATFSSFFGGIISAVMLALISPVIARFALNFGATEFAAIAIFGLSIMAYVSSGSFIKGLISGLLGVLLATVGVDQITGYPRFTYGQPELFTGIDFITAMIGLFGVGELMIHIQDGDGAVKQVKQVVKKVIPRFKDIFGNISILIRSSVIGVLIGAIPGAGGTIGAIVGYGQAKRLSSDSERFGKGHPAGIVAAESSNNACTGGALITLLSLGIPGDAITAILIGGLMLHGLRAGPMLFQTNFDLVSALLIGKVVANFFMLVLGILGIRFFARLISFPKEFLSPVILSLCLVGSYAIRYNRFDVLLMLGFGILGYIMTKTNIPRGPLVLALIIGPIFERNFRRALTVVGGDMMALLNRFLTRPVSLVILICTVILILMPVFFSIRDKKKASGNEVEIEE